MAFHKTAARLSNSVKRSQSKAWVSRQYRDPYVQKRLSHPYRSRSAFKLLEIEDQYKFLTAKDVNVVLDLGAAPGGWSQVVAEKFGWKPQILRSSRGVTEENGSILEDSETLWSDSVVPLVEESKVQRKGTNPTLGVFDPLNIDDIDLIPHSGRGTIIAVDLDIILPIAGVQTVKGDFLEERTMQIIRGLVLNANHEQPKVDVILSDMAANTFGNDMHDIQSSLEICEGVYDFATRNLRTADDVGEQKGGVLL